MAEQSKTVQGLVTCERIIFCVLLALNLVLLFVDRPQPKEK
jgi:hypothetical protein